MTGFSRRSPAGNGRRRGTGPEASRCLPVPWPTRVDGKPAGSITRTRPGSWPQDPRSPHAAWPAPESLPHRALRDLRPVRSRICGRPIRPGRRCSRDDAAPSLAGQRSDRPARVCCRRGGSRAHCPRPRPPEDSPVLCPDPRSSRLASRRCRRAGLAKPFLPRAESGKAPPCMRWRGLARPRRACWPVAWSSPRHAPPAGARYPRENRSPGSSHVPGVAPGRCPFPAVKAFLLPPQPQRKALPPAISCFSAIHEGIHRKHAVIRISQRLSTGLFTAYPQATGCKPENT